MVHKIERRVRGYRIKVGDVEIQIDFKTKTEAERWIANRLKWRQVYGGKNEQQRASN